MIKARLSVMLIASAGLLSACDGGGGAVAKGIDSLGAAFVAAFNKSRNSEPVDAQSVNLVLTPTIEPFDP